jgi:hypothetical protein
MNSDEIAEGIIKAALYLGAMAAIVYISYRYSEFFWLVWIGFIILSALFIGVRDDIVDHGIWRTLIRTLILLFGFFSIGYGVLAGYPNFSTAKGDSEWMSYIFAGLIVTGFLLKIYEATDTMLKKRRERKRDLSRNERSHSEP